MRQFIENSEGVFPEGELSARNVHAAGEHRLCLSKNKDYTTGRTNSSVVFAHLPTHPRIHSLYPILTQKPKSTGHWMLFLVLWRI